MAIILNLTIPWYLNFVKSKAVTPAPRETHPEDDIFRVKTFINQLSEVQEERFGALAKSLGLSGEGTDLLFDYVYNSDDERCFDEYLTEMGMDYSSLVSPEESGKGKQE